MKLSLPAVAIAACSLFGLVPLGAHAADGTISFTGTVTDSTCSINGNASGTPADKSVTLAPVSSGSLASAGAVAGTSNPTDLQLNLTGCSGTATKAIARFENGPSVDQSNGYLSNMGGTAQNVEVRLLNAQMQPINVATGANNDIATNAATITGDKATLQYFAQYYATGVAAPGTVSSSVQYTMEYQ
ncbi:P pilus assembly protein, pilin FimA [Burkholderia sp. Ch1-1]|jgi:major type 1 subunit fimbrin (pilin)|uniref:Major fimbrial subunit SMF-1 n=1 Tax=Paraburkholderia dioscoreae TaxID=2604047 RepID=A0A5Q4ZA02_9BURK|nr:MULTISPECIES: fimbrial protein [Paraburkholderia]EIF35486.1 P pilus assembly protein, pilin FimA [Burkholderia sp. Ch1-1]MDR8397365.1 type 1 fimbrial protein [Paraburkholderia sp. USG1]VVD31379.1 Major fimbrial subunit SMF-1 [Paraburkholderia dioscoreae]